MKRCDRWIHGTLILSAVASTSLSVVMGTYSTGTALLSITLLLWATLGTVCMLLVSLLRGHRRQALVTAGVATVIAGLIASESVFGTRYHVFLWTERGSLEAKISQQPGKRTPFVFCYPMHLWIGDDYYLVWDPEPSTDPDRFYNHQSAMDARYDLGGGWFGIVR